MRVPDSSDARASATPDEAGSFTPGYNNEAIADGAGSFAFANVPAGLRQFCVTTADPLHLDPCQWSRTAGYVTVPTGGGGVVTASPEKTSHEPTHLMGERHASA